MQRYPAFADILRQPDDDGPRLACADWCEAHGDPARAEFIRVQVRLAAKPHIAQSERIILRKQQHELLKLHAKRWLAELPELPGVTWIKRFERGFVSAVHLSELETLVQHHQAIFSSTPVRSLGCGEPKRQTLDLILKIIEEQKLSSLTLNGSHGIGIDDASAMILASSPSMRHLRFLSFHSNAFKKTASIGPDGAAAIADSPHLRNLRYLSLTQNPIGPEGIRALARGKCLPLLRSLELYGVEQDFDSTLELLRSPLVRQLRSLNVGGSSTITHEVARFIAASDNLENLRWLDLNNTNIGDAGIMYLAQSTGLPRLRRLYLRNCEFGDAGVITLARSPLAAQLRVLDIENCAVTQVGAWELVESPYLRGLRKLHMYDDDIREPVCQALKARFGKRVQIDIEDEKPKRIFARHVWRPTNGFLDDIRTNPEDDTPRLVYADWLDDSGDSQRAEFIRVQCALARMAEDNPRRAALSQQESELLEANAWQWTAGAFLHWLDHPPERCPVCTHELCVLMGDLLRLRKERQGAHLTASQKKSLAEKIRRREARFEAMDFAPEDCRLPLLKSFTFQRGFLHAVTVPEILFCFFAPAVRDLGMIRELTLAEDDDCERDFGDATIAGLVATMDQPLLTRLQLASIIEKIESLRTLAAWSGLARMKSLRGLFVMIQDEVAIVQTLLASPYLDCLEELHLVLGDGPADPPVNALIQSSGLPRIQRIHLQEAGDVSPAVQQQFQIRFPGVELLTGLSPPQ